MVQSRLVLLNHLSLNPGLPWKGGDDQEFREGGLGREEEGGEVQEMWLDQETEK